MDPQNPEQIPTIELVQSPRNPRRAARLAGRTGTYVAVAIAGLLVAGGSGYALASSASKSIHGCVNKHTGAVAVRAKCGANERALVWDREGPQGKPGTTTTITKLAPSGWTVDFVSAPAMSTAGQTDPDIATDSHGIKSVTVVQNGEDQVVATGCHDHAPTVLAQADPGAGTDGLVPQADPLVPDGGGFQSVEGARPDSSGDETFDVFTYVPDASADNSFGGGHIADADLAGNYFTLLIYC